MKTIIVALTLVLAACATPNDLRKTTPDLKVESDRDAKSIAMCIANGWENTRAIGGASPVTLRETPKGYMVYILCAGSNACLLADVKSLSAQRSMVIVYSQALLTTRFIDLAKECY